MGTSDVRWAIRRTDGHTKIKTMLKHAVTNKTSRYESIVDAAEAIERQSKKYPEDSYRLVRLTKRKKPSIEERIAEAVRAEREYLMTCVSTVTPNGMNRDVIKHRITNNPPPGEP